MKALEVIECSKTFSNGVHALRKVNLDLTEGHIGALVGPSGSGKTTLLRAIAGLESCDSGTIRIGGKTVFDRQTFIDPADRNVGFLFQDYALFPHMTVRQNVLFGLKKISPELREERMEKYLALCSVGDLQQRYPHQLSGGQQQRVALARALAAEPALLLLDEPFSNVDNTLKAYIRNEMAELIRHCEISALIVVHDIEDAYAIADQVSVLAEGALHQTADSETLYRFPASAAVAKVTGIASLVFAEATKTGFKSILGKHTASHVLSPGQEATLVFRPEELSLTAGKTWEIEEMRFAGAHVIIKCRNGLHLVEVRAPRQHPHKTGDRVGIEVVSDTLHWYTNTAP